jgi:hypothetical protein
METVQLNNTTVGDARINQVAGDYAAGLEFFLDLGLEDLAESESIVLEDASRVSSDNDLVIVSPPGTTRALEADASFQTHIVQFPGEPYALRRPMPVAIQMLEADDFEARFEEANLAVSGETIQEAFQNLAIEILNIFEIFNEEESNLGPEPTRQLRVLKQYLARV